MDVNLTPAVFALAGRNRSLSRLRADVVCFLKNGLELRKGHQTVQKWAWEDLRSIRYQHYKEGIPGTLMALGGGLLGGQSASLLIAGPEEKWDLLLEQDVNYRRRDLRKLFRELYLAGIDLREFTSNGLPAFLLEPLGEARLADRVAELEE